MALALAALLLLGAGIGVAATRDPDDESDAAAIQPEVTTSTVAPSTTTVPAETTTTQGFATTTTARPVTTTVVRATTTTTRRASTTTTTATARDCIANQIEVAATTDRASYPPSEQILFQSTLRNRSSTPCFYAGYEFQATFADPAGRRIIEFKTVSPGTRSPLAPGAVLTGSVPFDPRACQTQPCPTLTPGPGYSVTATWGLAGGPYQARATFALG